LYNEVKQVAFFNIEGNSLDNYILYNGQKKIYIPDWIFAQLYNCTVISENEILFVEDGVEYKITYDNDGFI